jgi:hypothetical protein
MDEPCWSLAGSLYGREALALATDVENSPSFLRPGDWYHRPRPARAPRRRYRPRAGEDRAARR